MQAAWTEHKGIHKQISADSWLYCTKRGKGRSTQQPEFAYTGSLRPHPIGPRRAVSPGLVLLACMPRLLSALADCALNLSTPGWACMDFCMAHEVHRHRSATSLVGAPQKTMCLVVAWPLR